MLKKKNKQNIVRKSLLFWLVFTTILVAGLVGIGGISIIQGAIMRLGNKNQAEKQVKTSPLYVPTITPTPTPKIIYVTITPTLTPPLTSIPTPVKHSAEYCDAIAEKVRAELIKKSENAGWEEEMRCKNEIFSMSDENLSSFGIEWLEEQMERCESKKEDLISELNISIDGIVANSRLTCLEN